MVKDSKLGCPEFVRLIPSRDQQEGATQCESPSDVPAASHVFDYGLSGQSLFTAPPLSNESLQTATTVLFNVFMSCPANQSNQRIS